MTTRIRSTWAGRTAGNPPAVPGYNVEDKDHPAHQPEPEAHKYENGTTSDWNEILASLRIPGQSPATPGYDIEDKDHPAHIDPPRWPEIKHRRRPSRPAKFNCASCSSPRPRESCTSRGLMMALQEGRNPAGDRGERTRPDGPVERTACRRWHSGSAAVSSQPTTRRTK